MPVARLKEIDMFYINEGEGIPLILIHGIGSSHQVWLHLFPALTKKFRVIAGDTRGHGNSSKPKGEYSIKLFTEDWAQLIEFLGLDSAYLMGASMGGAIAMQTALDHAEKVKALILVDTWAYPHPDFVAHIKKRIEVLEEGTLSEYMELTMPFVYSRQFLKEKPQIIDEHGARLAKTNLDALKASCRALLDFDVRERILQIKIPTLVIVGTNDLLLPPLHSEFISGCIEGSRYTAIKGAGHLPHVERPEEFVKAVFHFLEPLAHS